MAKSREQSFIIDRLWQGQSGQAPWQRHVGMVERGLNVRWDMTVGGAVKRNGLNLVSDLIDDNSAQTLIDAVDRYYWLAIRGAIIAIGDGVVYGWDADGNPLDVIDDSPDDSVFSVSSFMDYIDTDTPEDEITASVAFDTAIIVNRTSNPNRINAWSFRQSYNYIKNGDATPTDPLASAGFDPDTDTFDDFDAIPSSHQDDGRVVRTRGDYLLNPAGFYVWYDGSPYPNLDIAEQLFPAHGNWYRIPDGRGPSGTGNSIAQDTDEGQGGARFDPATMPHRIVYDEDAGTLTLNQTPWRQRLSGNNGTNQGMPWTSGGFRVRDAQFHSGRLFLLSQSHVTSSRKADYFNLWLDNVSSVSDNDRIIAEQIPADSGNCFRCAPCGTSLFINCENAQIAFGSGEEALTNANGRIQTITNFQGVDVPMGGESNTVAIVDEFGDVHQYRYMGAIAGIVYTSALTANYRSALYGKTVKRIFSINGSIYVTVEDGNVVANDIFILGEQMIQSAWGELEFHENAVFLHPWGGAIRIITRNPSESYSFCHYVHRDVEPPDGLLFRPYLDRMELAIPSEMTFDPNANTTTIPHTGRDGNLSRSMIVTTDDDHPLVFVPAKELDENGNPVFRGDWTSADVYLGFQFDFEVELSRMYPAITGFDFIFKDLAIYHYKTTDYSTSWIDKDGETKADHFQAKRVGEAVIGEPSVDTHYREVNLDCIDSRTAITISSDSPGPVNITAIEVNFVVGGRGQSS